MLNTNINNKDLLVSNSTNRSFLLLGCSQVRLEVTVFREQNDDNKVCVNAGGINVLTTRGLPFNKTTMFILRVPNASFNRISKRLPFLIYT